MPDRGKPEFEYVWHGARWRFSSAANKDEFSRNPEKYVPRYGGYRAYAVSLNKIADIDPEGMDDIRWEALSQPE